MRFLICGALLFLAIGCTAANQPAPTPTATAVPISSVTITPPISIVQTATPSETAAPTITITPSPESSVSPTTRPTAIPTLTPSPVVTSEVVSGWLVYRNEEYGFRFSYPAEADIKARQDSDSSEDDPGDICVSVGYQTGFITFRIPWESGDEYGDPCGRTGVGDYDIFPITETVMIDGHPYTAEGHEIRERDEAGTWLDEVLSLSLADGTSIQYGSATGTQEAYLKSKEILLQIIASFRSEATSLPIPTPTPTPIPGTVAIAPQITVGDWSPDGRFLTYWTHTAADLEANPQSPAGDFHFYDVVNERSCPFNDYRSGSTSWVRRHLWLPVPTGDILIFGDEEVLSFQPCGDNFVVHTDQFPERIIRVVAHSADRSHFLLVGGGRYWLFQFAGLDVRPVEGISEGFDNGASFSPDGRYVAISGDGGDSYVLDVGTAAATQVATWQGPQGLGGLAVPEWLSNTEFVIQSSRDQGPLLVSADASVQNVGAAFFGQAAAADHRAITSYTPTNGEFVVLLHDMEYEDEQPPLQLYYSATRATQSLHIESPLDRVYPSFAPGGRWLVLYDFSSGAPGSYDELWVRSLASTVSQQLRLFESDEAIHYSFAPGGERVALEVGNYIRIESVPISGKAQSQGYGRYDVGPHSWSPDGRFLAITGQGRRDEPPALFVLPVEATLP